MKSLFLLVLLMVCTLGCTENSMARKFGGKINKKLPSGQKLVNVTWKEASLWILTKKMNENDVAETYTFKEDSAFGFVEGEIVIIETK